MTIPPRPKIHIVGMGSMGTLLAVNLIKYSNASIIPLFRNKSRLEQFQNEGKSTIGIRKIYLDDAPLDTEVLKESYSPENFPGTTIENLVVTTKTYQTYDALKPYLPYINSNTNLILIQNGLGVLEVLKNEVFKSTNDKPNLFQAVISHGAFQDKGFIFNHAGFVDLKFARLPWVESETIQDQKFVEIDAMENTLVKLFTEPKFAKAIACKHMTYQELLFGQLYKFLINACINPVTAIIDCDNGELFSGCRPIFTSIVEECLSVLKVAYKTIFDYESNFNGKENYPSLQINSTFEIEKMVNVIINAGCVINAKNSSSMRQDTRFLRDTEIDYINGYIVQLAKSLNLGEDATKVNRTISELVELRLSVNRDRSKDK